MAEELKIVIDADVSGAIEGVNKFKKSVDGLTTGSIAQLQKAAMVLRTQLSNLSPSALKSDFGKQLTTALAGVNAELKTLQKEANLAGTATSGAFSKAFSGAKQLANIIPGLGISGLLLLASDAITELASSFIKAEKAAVRNSDAIEGATKSYAGAIANVNELRLNIGLAKDGFISKDAVVKQYNESIGKTTGLVKNLDEAEKALGKNADAYIQFTLLKAAANFALEEASKKAVKAALIPIEDVKKNLSFFQQLNLPFEKAPSRGAQEQKFLAPVIAGVKKEQSEFEKIAADFQARAAKISKEMGFSFFSDFKIDKTKLNDETDQVLARARQFVKEFGSVFVLPNLDETFFKGKKELLPIAKKLLEDVSKGNLKIKLPKVEFELLPENIVPLTDAQLQELTKGFFKGIGVEKGVPLEITFDPSLAPGSIDKINKKLDLKKQFEILGKLGTDAFNKIDFSNINDGIAAATKQLKNMMDVANTLNQAIGGGLVNAFNSVFDSILEGKSVFKALGEAIKQLVIGTIKAIAQMLILKAITNLIFPGSGVAGSAGKLVGAALGGTSSGFGLGGQIAGRSFNNTLNVVVQGQISGQNILLSGQRAAGSNSRFGG